MAFSNPPPAPQRGDRTTFSGRVDAFLTWLVNLVPQLAAFEGNLSTLAAGGANSFAYVFSGGTDDTDPGQGRLRFDGPTQAAATTIRIDTSTVAGVSILPLITALLAGTSNVKASIRIQKVGDTSSWLIFDVTGAAPASGYGNLLGSVRISSKPGNFFNPDDSLLVFIEPKGDRGDGGGTPTQQQIIDAIGVVQINKGGTGATTAASALTNLGALPKAGGMMTGSLSFANGFGIFSNDAQGTLRQVMKFDGDNNVNCVLGPSGWNFYNVNGTAIMARIDNSGAFSPAGAIRLKNTMSITMEDSAGTARTVAYMSGDNWLNFTGGPSGSRWINSAGNAVNAVLNDAGVFSAIGLSANTVTETSDERKKTNWRELTDAQLDALADLEKVGVFDWLDGSGAAVGASAQAIRAIVPEAVHEDADGNLSVAYGGLSFAMAQGALRRQLQQRHVGRAKGSW